MAIQEICQLSFHNVGRRINITIDPDTRMVSITESLDGDETLVTVTLAELYAALMIYETRNMGDGVTYSLPH